MTDCLFCAIGAGEIPAGLVHSDDAVLAFRDIDPQAPVHVLVIPRAHVANAAELAASDPALIGRLLQRVADPVAVLKKAAPHVARGGCVVAALPNVAHASVRLGLLRGAFEIGDAQGGCGGRSLPRAA